MKLLRMEMVKSMYTSIYMVRHGESPKTNEHERTRGLTEKGRLDAVKVAEQLQNEGIDVLLSSPYNRSVLTIQKLATRLKQDILTVEDLKERIFSPGDQPLSHEELIPLLEESFADWKYASKGGESNRDCQDRAVRAFTEILQTYKGKKIVIGTHGVVMTLIMNHYNSRYDINFVSQTSKPDIYKMEFQGENLIGVNRLWME